MEGELSGERRRQCLLSYFGEPPPAGTNECWPNDYDIVEQGTNLAPSISEAWSQKHRDVTQIRIKKKCTFTEVIYGLFGEEILKEATTWVVLIIHSFIVPAEVSRPL